MKCEGDRCSRLALLGEDYCADCLNDLREQGRGIPIFYRPTNEGEGE
jgi:hypothetical protein